MPTPAAGGLPGVRRVRQWRGGDTTATGVATHPSPGRHGAAFARQVSASASEDLQPGSLSFFYGRSCQPRRTPVAPAGEDPRRQPAGGDLRHDRRQRGDRDYRRGTRVRSAHPGGHPCHPAGLLARPRVRRLPRPCAPPRFVEAKAHGLRHGPGAFHAGCSRVVRLAVRSFDDHVVALFYLALALSGTAKCPPYMGQQVQTPPTRSTIVRTAPTTPRGRLPSCTVIGTTPPWRAERVVPQISRTDRDVRRVLPLLFLAPHRFPDGVRDG